MELLLIFTFIENKFTAISVSFMGLAEILGCGFGPRRGQDKMNTSLHHMIQCDLSDSSQWGSET